MPASSRGVMEGSLLCPPPDTQQTPSRHPAPLPWKATVGPPQHTVSPMLNIRETFASPVTPLSHRGGRRCQSVPTHTRVCMQYILTGVSDIDVSTQPDCVRARSSGWIRPLGRAVSIHGRASPTGLLGGQCLRLHSSSRKKTWGGVRGW